MAAKPRTESLSAKAVRAGIELAVQCDDVGAALYYASRAATAAHMGRHIEELLVSHTLAFVAPARANTLLSLTRAMVDAATTKPSLFLLHADTVLRAIVDSEVRGRAALHAYAAHRNPDADTRDSQPRMPLLAKRAKEPAFFVDCVSMKQDAKEFVTLGRAFARALVDGDYTAALESALDVIDVARAVCDQPRRRVSASKLRIDSKPRKPVMAKLRPCGKHLGHFTFDFALWEMLLGHARGVPALYPFTKHMASAYAERLPSDRVRPLFLVQAVLAAIHFNADTPTTAAELVAGSKMLPRMMSRAVREQAAPTLPATPPVDKRRTCAGFRDEDEWREWRAAFDAQQAPPLASKTKKKTPKRKSEASEEAPKPKKPKVQQEEDTRDPALPARIGPWRVLSSRAYRTDSFIVRVTRDTAVTTRYVRLLRQTQLPPELGVVDRLKAQVGLVPQEAQTFTEGAQRWLVMRDLTSPRAHGRVFSVEAAWPELARLYGAAFWSELIDLLVWRRVVGCGAHTHLRDLVWLPTEKRIASVRETYADASPLASPRLSSLLSGMLPTHFLRALEAAPHQLRATLDGWTARLGHTPAERQLAHRIATVRTELAPLLAV
ncbi:MAG: hypothetical protein Q7V62_13855 [Actinomycetota bacterium]|nr:hypothetical protein [Actinomycetota bacterium]